MKHQMGDDTGVCFRFECILYRIGLMTVFFNWCDLSDKARYHCDKVLGVSHEV